MSASGDPTGDLVVHALRRIEAVPGWSLRTWELLIRQARRADLLARIAALLKTRGQLDAVPAAPRAHLHAALAVARSQHEEIDREVLHLGRALADAGQPLVLLKGAAYVQAGLPAGVGRVFSDTDILVPKHSLPEVESRLMMHGWQAGHHTAYDQRYYREWMHEIPPLEHSRRGTVVDVHHAILPETARLKPDPARLLAAVQPVARAADVFVLQPTDMVLHSMTHLFHNEDLSHGLRDLSDLDLLLRHFGAESGFWNRLVSRGAELDLARPLHYGLRCANLILDTPVPADTLRAGGLAGPAWPLSPLMDALWCRALRSQHPGCAAPFTPAALFLLYVRAHWLRMPPLLLMRHLSIKAWQRTRPVQPTAQ